MSYFFRRSMSLGPIRLNLSKSGVGASLGVKGARLTMAPRGTTYITVGSHGFYYRETLSRRGGGAAGPTPSPITTPIAPPTDEIITANVSDLVDSSSEALIRSLNERAQMFNLAWFIYAIGTALSVWGIVMLSSAQILPDKLPPPPDVTPAFIEARQANTTDEYRILLDRYGEPDSVVSTEFANVPFGTAQYNSANVSVDFVPNGCVSTYAAALGNLPEKPAKSWMRSRQRCVPQPKTGWTIVGYRFSTQKTAAVPPSPDTAKSLLDKITLKRTSPPAEITDFPKRANSGGSSKKSTRPRLGLQSDEEARALEEQARQRSTQQKHDTEAAARQEQFSGAALLVGSVVLIVAGGVTHKRNTIKRTSRLFYELDEKRGQKFSTAQQAFAHLSKGSRKNNFTD
jgi:hypothetical protein